MKKFLIVVMLMSLPVVAFATVSTKVTIYLADSTNLEKDGLNEMGLGYECEWSEKREDRTVYAYYDAKVKTAVISVNNVKVVGCDEKPFKEQE